MFKGHSRIARSIFIAKHCEPLAIEAYKLALEDIKNKSLNVTKYNQVLESLNAILRDKGQPLVQADDNWISSAISRNKITGESLENELKSAKGNVLKEEIRASILEFNISQLTNIQNSCVIRSLVITFTIRETFQLQ